ncbi:MAG: ABC transporter permease [Xanthomonadales bacterium]|nr:ABC transporter permease [Xanthomonadales bacterium]MCB1578061.1 ABC transporter permease [Xanthomonadales bacterium]
MKYFHLIWAALFRRKTRTMLTLLSVLAAFLLFGLLDAVRVAFNAGSDAAGVDRMVVSSKYSIIQGLPQSLIPRIQATPGVKNLTWANWFGGYYQDRKNQGINIAINPGYFDIYPEISVPAEQLEAFKKTRTGAIVGETLAKRFGWKIGDKVPIAGAIYPNKASGETTWTFDIVGIYKVKEEKLKGLEQQFFFRWDYFDEANSYGTHEVGWYIVQVTDPKQSDAVAKAIDAISANSDHETKTQTEQAFNLSFAKQLGDIGLIVSAIMGAVFFTLLLLTGNTMAQAVRERIPELATLKTIGFSDVSLLGLVFAEAVLLIVIGGVLGMALVSLLLPVIGDATGGRMQLPPVGAGTWGIGIGLMILIGLLVGVLPALRAMRLNIVDALAGR